MADSEFPKLYLGGAGQADDSPQNDQAFLDMVKKIKTGDRGMRGVTCPHCLNFALIRTSKQLSRLVRETNCQCQNIACGHTFVAHVEVVRTISPAAFPNPDVSAQLPQGEQAKRLHGDANAGCESG